MYIKDLAVYEGIVNQSGYLNRSGSCSADLTGHFGHLVIKLFNVFSGFVREPHFLQGLDKRANSGIVDLLLLYYDGVEYLGSGGVIPKVFFSILPELECDGREHSLFSPSSIVAVKVAYKETISFSVPNPCSCKSLYPLGLFSSSDSPQSYRR